MSDTDLDALHEAATCPTCGSNNPVHRQRMWKAPGNFGYCDDAFHDAPASLRPVPRDADVEALAVELKKRVNASQFGMPAEEVSPTWELIDRLATLASEAVSLRGRVEALERENERLRKENRKLRYTLDWTRDVLTDAVTNSIPSYRKDVVQTMDEESDYLFADKGMVRNILDRIDRVLTAAHSALTSDTEEVEGQ